MARIPEICKRYDSKEVIEAFKELEKYFLDPSGYAYCRCETHPMKEKEKMEFDKSKILTCVTADQAKVGQKGWFGEYLDTLKERVEKEQPNVLERVDLSGKARYIFKTNCDGFSLFYPAPEPTYEERQAEWVKKHSLKEGDKVKILRTAKEDENGWENVWTESMTKMVGRVFEYCAEYWNGIHLSCGYEWPYFVLEVIKEPTYRPYNNDELNDLVGEVLTNKQSGRKKLVTGKPTASEGVNLDGSYITAKDLLASFYRNTNKPCGVREDD